MEFGPPSVQNCGEWENYLQDWVQKRKLQLAKWKEGSYSNQQFTVEETEINRQLLCRKCS